MSRPRPIHHLHRELRTSPDEAEPSLSFENESFLLGQAAALSSRAHQDVEDEFHRRLAANSASSRRDSSGNSNNNSSFWRSTSAGSQATVSLSSSTRSTGSAAAAAAGQHQRTPSCESNNGKAAAESPLTNKSDHSQRTERTANEGYHSYTTSNGGGGGSGGNVKASLNNKKKDATKQREADRRRKLLDQSTEFDVDGEGNLNTDSTVDTDQPQLQSSHQQQSTFATLNTTSTSIGAAVVGLPLLPPSAAGTTLPPVNFADMMAHGSPALDRSSSAESTGSLFYGKTPNSGAVLGKSSSLIFPTGVDTSNDNDNINNNLVYSTQNENDLQAEAKRRKINLLLDQCESVRFPFKKKLTLNNMSLTAQDIPLSDLIHTSLGSSLFKLSLAGNRLGTVPAPLVVNLPALKHLDLSQCELHQLPDTWLLPKLTRLNLSHNRLTDFPEEGMLEGLPELHELNMYGNKVAEIIIPGGSRNNGTKLLSKLESLNLGYNDIAYLPDDLDQLESLQTLKVMNNFLEKVPMRVCDMELRAIDVSSNPVIQPPIETCERGICAMKRYYHCLRMEEQSKSKALEEVQRKAKTRQQKKKEIKKKGFGGLLLKSLRRSSDESGSVASASSHSAVAPASAAALKSTKSSLSSSTSSAAPAATAPAAADPSLSSPKPLLSLSAATTSTATALPPPQQQEQKQQNEEIFQESLVEEEVLFPSSITKPSSLDGLAKPHRAAFSLEDDQGYDSDLGAMAATTTTPAVSFASTPDDLSSDDLATSVNDTLKVIFVGMAMVGKTSMIKRLIEGRDAVIPTHDERTVGVDIYEWDPKKDRRFEDIDSRIIFQDQELSEQCGDVHVQFSVWDFAGQHVYHATHELFFSPRALYVLVWDMGATNRATLRKKGSGIDETGAFKLTYDSSDDEEEEEGDDCAEEEEARRADRALERDIDEKVQFWVDCIQSSTPGAAILPVASFSDYFENDGGDAEAKRRCNMLKQRLLKHEERRLNGIKERLKELTDQKRANDPAALRLRKLLCPYTRPKLIFGDGEDSVVRVSGTQYTGFHELTQKIISISIGVEKGKWRYPIFQGHVGARIPRMRLQVREAVRTMRDRFKVVEWGYFINQLRDRGLTSAEDISDALFFLTNIGELSYFGGVVANGRELANPVEGEVLPCNATRRGDEVGSKGTDDDEDEFDDDQAILSIDDTSITAPSTSDGSTTTADDFMSGGLSQFVFLNPRWLVAAVACILRHDLDREIKETRRQASVAGARQLTHASSFYEAHLNCPVITGEDACLLWQAKRITKKAAERAQEYSNNMAITPFEFLQQLLIRFGVFVPIDLSIEKAFLGGKEYAHLVESINRLEEPREISSDGTADDSAKFFFLPSLLGPCEPSDAWTYKSTDSWKTTLCHSVLFPDGVPPGLMERLTASVLSSIYDVAHRKEDTPSTVFYGQRVATYEGQLSVKEVLCWRTAFFIKLGAKAKASDGSFKESIVEIFTHIADRDSHLCVGSDYMGVGMRRLIVSGRGQVGDGGRKIWNGGYLLVVKCINRVMDNYGGLEYERHGFCPECLSKKAVSEASSWEFTNVRSAVMNHEDTLRCQHGHRVDTRLIAGPSDNLQKDKNLPAGGDVVVSADTVVPVQDLLRAVVVVGLWDGKAQKVVRVGSGFIVDRKRGLIVTAAHTLMNIWGDKNYPFGENYYGLRQGKVVIGIIPDDKEVDGTNGRDMAVFRYFAKIVSKDSSLDNGECRLDACVLKITTRMENDVGGDGEGCGDQPEKLLLNDPRALKNEQLQSLKMTEKCELDEQVRILGYNQGGEGLLSPGESLNRYVDFARGYVCMKFIPPSQDTGGKLRDRFKPRVEYVVICPTISGHSGGPVVNQQGEVIGILSRADPAENQRCYISPTHEWKSLVKQAKFAL